MENCVEILVKKRMVITGDLDSFSNPEILTEIAKLQKKKSGCTPFLNPQILRVL